MYAGRIVEEGPNDKVFADAAHPYTRALAAAFPVIGDARFRMNPSGLPGDPPDPRDVPSGCPFHPRCPEAIDICPRTEVELWPAGARPRGGVRARVRLAGGDVNGSRRALVEVRDLHVQYPGRPRRPGARGGRREPRRVRGRDAGARGRVGLRQDHAGARDHGAPPPHVRRDPLPRRAALVRPRRHARAPPPRADDLPGPDRRAERAPDAVRGGGRGHPHPERPGQRGGARGRGAVAGRPAPAGELLHALSRTRSRAASASA